MLVGGTGKSGRLRAGWLSAKAFPHPPGKGEVGGARAQVQGVFHPCQWSGLPPTCFP